MTENPLLKLIQGTVLVVLLLSSIGGEASSHGDADQMKKSPLRLEPETIPYSEMIPTCRPGPRKTLSLAYPSIDTRICTRAISMSPFTKLPQ